MDHEFVRLFGEVFLIDTPAERRAARRAMRAQRVEELPIWVETASESVPTEEKFSAKAGR